MKKIDYVLLKIIENGFVENDNYNLVLTKKGKEAVSYYCSENRGGLDKVLSHQEQYFFEPSSMDEVYLPPERFL